MCCLAADSQPKPARGEAASLGLQIPDDILHNENLRAAMKVLPMNYSFEVRFQRGGDCGLACMHRRPACNPVCIVHELYIRLLQRQRQVLFSSQHAVLRLHARQPDRCDIVAGSCRS